MKSKEEIEKIIDEIEVAKKLINEIDENIKKYRKEIEDSAGI